MEINVLLIVWLLQVQFIVSHKDTQAQKIQITEKPLLVLASVLLSLEKCGFLDFLFPFSSFFLSFSSFFLSCLLACLLSCLLSCFLAFLLFFLPPSLPPSVPPSLLSAPEGAGPHRPCWFKAALTREGATGAWVPL